MTKKITVAAVARSLGVSSTTVSFVLNGRKKGISAETRERVIRAAETMGYRKLPQANLQGWSRAAYLTTQIAHFNFTTSFFAEVFRHLEKKGFERKIEVSLQEADPQNQEVFWRKVEQVRSLGYEVFLTSNREIARALLNRHLPTILLQAGGTLEGCINITCDDTRAGAIAAEQILARGHNRAGLIFPEECRHPRYDGFLSTFTAGGGRVLNRFNWTVPWNHEAMEKQLITLASARDLPPVFYCFADNLLFPAIRAFAANGWRVPQDIGLIGTDNLYWGRFASPSFTTIDLEEELFAERLLDGIVHALQGSAPYSLAVPVRWIPRESF